MRKISELMLLSAVLLAPGYVCAQGQRPLPAQAPATFAAGGLRVHLRAHEDLDPDRLRDLSRPGVSLWLSTRTNTLRSSTVENVARFDASWVQLRSPLKSVDARVFSQLPRAGAWLSVAALEVSTHLPGARRVAVLVSGAFDEPMISELRAARPAEIHWQPRGEVDLLAWSQFRQLPGRKIVIAAADQLWPVACGERSAREPSAEIHIGSLLSASSDVFPCGRGSRVEIEPKVDFWVIQSLVVRDPSVELIIDVGADVERALAARRLLEQFGVGPSR